MRQWFKSFEFWVVLGIASIGAGLRLWRLNEPSEFVFDEVYYAKWGNDYLLGNSFFDVHPPLGKLLIAVGIKFFGYTPFGWRIMPAIFGMAVIPLTYLIAKKLFRQTSDPTNQSPPQKNSQRPTVISLIGQYLLSKVTTIHPIGLLASLFVLIDGLLLVQSRTALLDSFQITFVLATTACFLAFRDAQNRRSATVWLILTGIFLGLSLATKWTTLAIFGLVGLYMIIWRRTLPRVSALAYLVSFFILPPAIYIASFIFNQRTTDFWNYLIDWHKQTWNFHHTLTATHPYMSRWWSWLYLGRPVWYYFKEADGAIRGIIALGNPVLWWSAIPALLTTLWVTRRDLAQGPAFAMLAVLAFYLPWSLISRTQFQYYIVPAIPFLMIILAWYLTQLRTKLRNRIITGLASLAIFVFVFWYPLLIGYPISSAFYRAHLWFRSWI